jgi:macrolide transport system ATP-binding/permease protein
VNRPRLLLADEPTGNLDTTTSLEIMRIIEQLNREQGITVVLVTHEPEIAAYADRVLTFRDGVIIDDVAQDRSLTLSDSTPPRAALASEFAEGTS